MPGVQADAASRSQLTTEKRVPHIGSSESQGFEFQSEEGVVQEALHKYLTGPSRVEAQEYRAKPSCSSGQSGGNLGVRLQAQGCNLRIRACNLSCLALGYREDQL